MATSQAEENFLTPSTLSKHNGENSNNSGSGANFFRNAGKTESMLSEVSNMTNDSDEISKAKKEDVGLLRDILQTENDLAGFSFVWAIGFVIIFVLKLIGHEDTKEAKWYWVILIPIAICCLTWVFSYVITTYRKLQFVESMKIPAFILPFFTKIAIALVLFYRLFYAKGGITDTYNEEEAYSGWCDASMVVIWIALLLAVVTTEIIITTVMVNSSQNLQKQVPKKVDFFLFLTRPTIWVYNRLIVMFFVFYVFYYVFGLGPLCTSQCKVPEVKDLQSIGVMFFTLPFRNVLYLFEWKQFDLTTYETSREKTFAVIQQVLIFTTILDLLMDIWSVSQICKRIEVEPFRQFAAATMRGRKSKGKPVMPAINEERNSNKLTKLKPAGAESGDYGSGGGGGVNGTNGSGGGVNGTNEALNMEEVHSPSDDDMDDELAALNNMGREEPNNNNKDEKKDVEEEEEAQDQDQDDNDDEVDHEVISSKHKMVDTVDDILENYNLNDMNVSETSDEQEVDPDDQPGYNNLASESQSKLSKHSSDRKLGAVKPALETINSENNDTK